MIKKQFKTTEPGLYTEELQQLVLRAKSGDAAALPELMKALDDLPELCEKVGNVAAHVEATWLKLLAGSDLFTGECLRRQLKRRRRELLGDNPTPIQRQLVERVLACWLRAQYVELELAQATAKNRSALQRTLDAAERQHLAAIKQLVKLQKPSRDRTRKRKTSLRRKRLIPLGLNLDRPLNASTASGTRGRGELNNRLRSYLGETLTN